MSLGAARTSLTVKAVGEDGEQGKTNTREGIMRNTMTLMLGVAGLFLVQSACAILPFGSNADPVFVQCSSPTPNGFSGRPIGTVNDPLYVSCSSTTLSDSSRVLRAGDTMTGSLTIANVGLTLTGPSGRIVGASSVTASAFFGSGAGLSGVTGTDASRVLKAGDTMTGALTVQSSVTASAFFGDGSALSGVTGTDPSKVALAGDTMTGALTVQSSVTASGFFGDGAGLTGVAGTDSTKVLKAGDTMTGDLTSPNLNATYSLTAGSITLNSGLLTVPATGYYVQASSFTLDSNGGRDTFFFGHGSNGSVTLDAISMQGATSNGFTVNGKTGCGTPAVPAFCPADTALFSIGGGSYDPATGTTTVRGRFEVLTSEVWTSTSTPAYIRFQTTPTGSITRSTRMQIQPSGRVGIGTITPINLLDVQGPATFGTNKSGFGTAGYLFTASGSSFTMSGAAGFMTSGSSVTASGFFGNGSGVTNVMAMGVGTKTKAQFDATTPMLGDMYLCSDCTVPYDICAATAASLGSFRATLNSAINTVVPGTLVPKGCGTGE